jgi:hypothetical protein
LQRTRNLDGLYQDYRHDRGGSRHATWSRIRPAPHVPASNAMPPADRYDGDRSTG